MTPERLADIEARDKAATEGPWVGRHGDVWIEGGLTNRDQIARVSLAGKDSDTFWANVDFIAHARQDIPDLIAYIRELEADQKELLTEHNAALAAIRAAE